MKRVLVIVTLIGLLSIAAVAQDSKIETGTINGAAFRIEMPGTWNKGLVMYCHGYQVVGTPNNFENPRAQSLRKEFLSRGFAFAESAYSTQGWALKEAVEDTEALRRYFVTKYGKPTEAIVLGHSMGGAITIATIEKYPEVYDGALPMCGPLNVILNGFQERIFDMLVTFDFLFPNVVGSLSNLPQGAKLGPNLFATSSSSFREQIARTPMSQQWNLSLQQQLGGGFLVEVAYSANHGTHLLTGNYDLNQADPALVRQFGLAGQLTNNVTNPYVGKVPGAFGGATITQSQAIRPFPYVGGITVQSPHQGNSIYHSLLVSAEKRFSKGFTLLASYTFAKLISDSIYNGLNFIGSEGGNEFGYQNGLYNRRAERAEDPSNVPHRLVVSGLFELPVGKGKKLDFKNGVANNILGNWQLNTITTIVQGTPTVVRGANNGLANRPDWVGSLELPSGFTDANPQRGVQWFNTAAFLNPALYTFGNTPRAISQFRNPGAVIIDLSVFKNFVITEKLKLQFRAEAFNAPNHVNLGSPNTSFGAGPGGTNNNDAFGRITSSRDPRNMQLGLKLIF